MRCSIVIAAAVGSLLACGSPLDPETPPGVAHIELGTGVGTFVPLSDGDPIEVVAGIQGGYHVVASLRVVGVTPGDPEHFSEANPIVDFDVLMAGRGIDLSEPLPIGLAPADAGRYQRTGRRVLLANAVVTPLEAFDGTAMRLVVFVADAEGRTLETGVDVVARTR